MGNTGITLTRHILMQQQSHPGATGEFSILLSQIALAAITTNKGAPSKARSTSSGPIAIMMVRLP